MNFETKGVSLFSETGVLEEVIVHSPGSEVENMTPENAERALYSDILNLAVAGAEFKQLKGVLEKVARVFEVEDLLAHVLTDTSVRQELVKKVTACCDDPHLNESIERMDERQLAVALIEGIPMSRDSLSRYLNPQRFALRPLHNFFFMRDASVSYGNQVLISKMASQVRERESMIMNTIFSAMNGFGATTLAPNRKDRHYRDISFEGGDILVAGDNLTLIGIGSRTTPQGVDFIVEKLRESKREPHHILVQELPRTRESFIHLDMVFTFLSRTECMVFDPVVLQPNRFKTIHILVDNGRVAINEEQNLLESLRMLGWDLTPLHCGGKKDLWTQEREQWHSGANFFAFAPGKVIGYNRNVYTLEELNHHGYEILNSKDVISGKVHPDQYSKCVVGIPGAELSRGGGGARCMTMPVRRMPLD